MTDPRVEAAWQASYTWDPESDGDFMAYLLAAADAVEEDRPLYSEEFKERWRNAHPDSGGGVEASREDRAVDLELRKIQAKREIAKAQAVIDFGEGNSGHDTDCDCKACLIDAWHSEVAAAEARVVELTSLVAEAFTYENANRSARWRARANVALAAADAVEGDR